ncbi:MAG: bifunctional DNA primase/polymerase [Planctomycetota bacterium]
MRADKTPHTAHGFRDATTDQRQIEEWWARWPDAQIGVATGEAGLLVVDLDLDEPRQRDGLRAFAQLVDEHGLDDCGLVASTPRGGEHRFFAMPQPPIRSGTDVLRGIGTTVRGIDVRAEGGYVVLPSAASPGRAWTTGDPFETWEDDGEQRGHLGAAPEWLLALLRERSSPTTSSSGPTVGLNSATAAPVDAELLRDLRRALPWIESDPRDAWIRVGMGLRSTGWGEPAYDLWCGWSKTSSKFDEREQRRQWESLSEYRADASEVTHRTIFWMALEAGMPRDSVPEAAFEGGGASGTSSERREATLGTTFADWERTRPIVRAQTGIASLDEFLRGGLPFGELAVLLGAPDAGKTMLLVELADSWASLGHVVGILAVDEDPSGLATRFAQRRGFTREECESGRPDAIAAFRDRTAAVDELVRFYGEDWTVDLAAERVATIAAERGIRGALLVDSLQTVRCRAETPKDGLREVVGLRVRALRRAAQDRGLAVVTTSEMVRASYRARGVDVADLAAGKESGSIEYQAKVLVALRSVRGEPDIVSLRIAKNKVGGRIHDPDDPADAIYLRVDRATQTIAESDYRPAEELEKPTREDARHSKALARQEADAAIVATVIARRPGITKRDLYPAAKVAAGSMSKDRINTALEVLQSAVIVVQVGYRQTHFLDGAKVPTGVLARVPDGDRDQVRASSAPAVADTDSDGPPEDDSSLDEFESGSSARSESSGTAIRNESPEAFRRSAVPAPPLGGQERNGTTGDGHPPTQTDGVPDPMQSDSEDSIGGLEE